MLGKKEFEFLLVILLDAIDDLTWQAHVSIFGILFAIRVIGESSALFLKHIRHAGAHDTLLVTGVGCRTQVVFLLLIFFVLLSLSKLLLLSYDFTPQWFIIIFEVRGV